MRVESVEFRVSGKFRVESWGLAWMFWAGLFRGSKSDMNLILFFVNKSDVNLFLRRPVLIGRLLLDIEGGLAGCFENLWEEGTGGDGDFHFVIE